MVLLVAGRCEASPVAGDVLVLLLLLVVELPMLVGSLVSLVVVMLMLLSLLLSLSLLLLLLVVVAAAVVVLCSGTELNSVTPLRWARWTSHATLYCFRDGVLVRKGSWVWKYQGQLWRKSRAKQMHICISICFLATRMSSIQV